MDTYDIIVIGGGIVGLWSAYNSCKLGLKTLLLEQFALPHSRGSSHGHSRIAALINGSEYATRMMPEAFKMWETLQDDSHVKLVLNCGCLTILDSEGDRMSYLTHANDLKIPHELLTGREVSRRFPGLNITDHLHCVYDRHASVINPEKCIPILINQIKKMGGEIAEGICVDNVIPVAHDKVIVRSNDRKFTAKSLIITCGPWAKKMLNKIGIDLPVKSLRITVHYFKEIGNKGLYKLENNFPSIVDCSGKVETWSIPSYEYPGLMKLCYCGGVEADPDTRDENISIVENYRRRRLDDLRKEKLNWYSHLDSNPKLTETCMYTNTSDMELVIDRHPKFPNIVFGAGFSGEGFQTSPVVGKILVSMATGEYAPEFVKTFSMKRFNATNYSAKL